MAVATQPVGIFEVAPDAYHADAVAKVPTLSASIAAMLCTSSPAHARAAHPKLNPDFKREERTEFDIGSVAHRLLLENRPLEEACEIIDAPDWRTKAAKAARDEAREAGKVPLLTKHAAAVGAMFDAAGEQLAAIDATPGFFIDGKPEQTLVWEEEGGVVCRALVDWLHDDYSAIDDYKTTSASASPERWTRTLFTIGADVQVAFYLRGLRAVTGETSDADFRFVVQETYPPYALCPIGLGPDVMALAERKVEWAIRRWRICLDTGLWAAYPDEVCFAELPAWEEARWMEKEAREEIAA